MFLLLYAVLHLSSIVGMLMYSKCLLNFLENYLPVYFDLPPPPTPIYLAPEIIHGETRALVLVSALVLVLLVKTRLKIL